MAYIGKNPKSNTKTLTPQSADPSNPTTGMLFYSNGTPRQAGVWYYTGADWQLVESPSTDPIATKTATFTAATSEKILLCDATSGAITVDLPTASGNDGQVYRIKKIDSSTNAVTIDPNGSETIEGASTKVIYIQYESVDIVSDGTNWSILQENKVEVLATATGDGNASYANATAEVVLFDTDEVDTHSSYDSTTGIFTAPKDGTLSINAQSGFFTTWSDSESITLSLDIDTGGGYTEIITDTYQFYANTGGDRRGLPKLNWKVQVSQGDNVRIRKFHNAGSTISTDDSNRSYVAFRLI